MPVLQRGHSNHEYSSEVVDPLTVVEVLIPISYSISLVSSSSSSNSKNKDSSSSGCDYEIEKSPLLLPPKKEEDIKKEFIIPNSSRDELTDCDLDLDELEFDEFEDEEEGSGDVTSTTHSLSSISEPIIHSIPSSSSLSRKRTIEEEEEEEEESILYNPNPVPCLHCQGGVGKDHLSIFGELIWPIQLDVDLIKTLIQLCPDFFVDFNEVEMDPMELGIESSNFNSEDPSSSSSQQQPTSSTFLIDQSETVPSESPPRIDDSPLQPSMDRNKESLKVKLLLRRPMNQLVEQGILPPPKTPIAFAGQRVRLERARMGDLLKAKIQQRPARQELIRQHILEDSDARVAPSLAEKQRMLKRARLADSLNDHLLHRPGPLELVKKNILHAPDAIIDQAIKEGVVPFKATSEGACGLHVPSNIYLSEDDSSSDLSSPAGTPDQSQSSSSSVEIPPTPPPKVFNVTPTNNQVQSPSCTTTILQSSPIPPSLLSPIPSCPPPTPTSNQFQIPPPPPPPPLSNNIIQNELLSKIVKAAVSSSTTPPISSAQLTLSKLSNLEHQQLISAVQNQSTGSRNLQQQGNNVFSQQHSSSGKTRSAKKSATKIKAQPKARQIKFHEYKGPPSAQKGQQQMQQQEVESSYELLLQQQQLFLQWQLECRHKYPQIILPAVSKLSSPTEVAGSFASAVAGGNAAVSMVSGGSIVSATATAPLVRSPSTIASVTNSNNTGSPGQQPIAPAPPPPITVQALVEKYNRNASTVSATLPLKLSLPSGLTPTVTEIRPKLTPTRSLDSSPKSSIGPHLDISKLNDWKVSDLKAELKKRNLPVSGAKPQLIERLKCADVSLQDESITSSSSNGGASAKTSVKSELSQMEESSSCSEMMDVGEGNQSGTKTSTENVGKTSNVAALNAAMLTLLQNNNLGNNGVIPVHILNALANVAKNANSGKNGKTQNIVVVDEKLLREQQIEQLQQALRNSQAQHQQMKISQMQAGTGQKHRIALQQHLQQKMQQQALQSQLQKLIQLHTLQQQQQKSQQASIGNEKSSGLKIAIGSQKHTPSTKSCFEESANSSRDSTLTLHQSEERDGTVFVENGEQVPVVNSLPFTIVKIETINQNQMMQGGDTSTDYSHIPQLQIPDVKTAFRTGESDSSSQSTTKSGSFSSESGDPMDHSWLLKINETPPPSSSSDSNKKSVVKEYTTFFENFANGEKKEEPKLQIPKPRRGFKSQMVDDVLEILIRNGELPPSAAQEPATPTTPGKSPRILPYPTPESSKMKTATTTPPPPPPLPPPTFAITLPTSIAFTRSPTANNQPSYHQSEITTQDPPPPYPTTLSKEAQDILKISQDLSNFGKAHAQNESERIFSTNIGTGTNENLDDTMIAMFLHEVQKDAEMELDNQGFNSQQPPPPAYSPPKNDVQMDTIKVEEPSLKHDDLLDELGTLLPPDLDVSMPMEMDYSDWLDQLLPENSQGFGESTIPPTTGGSGSNNNVISPNNNFFMDYHHESSDGQFGNNRDPLLSSRSFNNIFSESQGVVGGDGDRKGRASSPMAIGENLLWDFV